MMDKTIITTRENTKTMGQKNKETDNHWQREERGKVIGRKHSGRWQKTKREINARHINGGGTKNEDDWPKKKQHMNGETKGKKWWQSQEK